MTYEKLELVNALMSGEIYLSKILKNGTMSDNRRIMTKECLRATTEWFMNNKNKCIQYEHPFEDGHLSLFYTDDDEKAERILAILQEGDSN